MIFPMYLNNKNQVNIDLVPTEYHTHACLIVCIFITALFIRTYYITEIK